MFDLVPASINFHRTELTPRLRYLVDVPLPPSGREGAEFDSEVLLQIRRGLGLPKASRSSYRGAGVKSEVGCSLNLVN